MSWNPFERDDQNAPQPRSDRAPSGAPRDAGNIAGIAEIEMMGQTAVATFTETELSQETGAEQLADLLQQLAETGALHFVLDVQSVQYMDTACLGVLVQALNGMAARGGRIALANPNHSVHYIFRLTRLDRVFMICSNVMAALDAVERKREAG